MFVKIFIKRRVHENQSSELTKLLTELRSMTLGQPGYISGESLTRVDKRGESMVVSTWRSVEDWNKWVNNPQRIEVQAKIDSLLGNTTEYAIYST